MAKTREELVSVLEFILKQPENECIEFKRAEEKFDVDKIGRYFSAIGNEANLKNKQYGWLIFGIDDKTHELTNTKYCSNNNFNEIKKLIFDNTTDNMTFIDVYHIEIDGNRVVMFQIPAASGVPIAWKGNYYGRSGESLVPLSLDKIEQIRATANYDWSRQIIENATIDNLDENAIKLARKKFKKKFRGKPIAKEIDSMSDIDFLNKAKITLDGKITNAAMVLLGKYDDDYLLGEYHARISWQLIEKNETIDYEHFGIPFIINIEAAKDKIRKLSYRYLPDRTTTSVTTTDKYDDFVLRELINNAVVHQDYRLKGNINIMEYSDKIIINSEGRFIPGNVETVLFDGFSSPYYRNQFLASAMANLDMIDTIGSGIRRIYNVQKDKYFPLPDYDLSEYNRVKVILYGAVIDNSYTRMLFEKTELNLKQICLLDKIQKKVRITKEESDYLRKDGLIKGRYPNIFVSSGVAVEVAEKVRYVRNKGESNDRYKEDILDCIKDFGSASKSEIRQFLDNKLPAYLDEQGRNEKVKYLLKSLRKANKIYPEGNSRNIRWKIRQ